MANTVTRLQTAPPVKQQQAGVPAQQDWWWDGQGWQCGCGDGNFPFPPGGFYPPPGGQPPWYPGANGGVSFSPTAPPNPIRGAFWWDGFALWLFDGAAWVQVGGSGQVMGSNLNFAITAPTQLPVNTVTWTIVPFTTSPTIDTFNGYDPVTHKWTPKEAGLYFVEVRGFFQNVGAGCGIAIAKNDPGSFGGQASDITIAIVTSPQTAYWLSASGLAQMNGSTDYLRMFAWAASGEYGPIGASPAWGAALV